MRYKYLHNGFTLIEIIIFIVVMGLIGTTILSSMNIVARGIPLMKKQVIATQIAVGGIEWFLGQRYTKGFNALSSCSLPTTDVLDIPAGYNANVSCAKDDGSNNCNGKFITVNVTEANNSKILTSLSICLVDY